MNWSIRPMEIKDVPILVEWYYNEALHNTASPVDFKLYTLEEITDYWREKLSLPNAYYYAILVDEQVVGRVGVRKKKKEYRYIADYSILIGSSNLYSKGLGTEITKYIVTEAFLDSEVLSVYLSVRADNKRTIRCYEKVGFQITGDFIENNIEMYEMRIDKNH
jgi:RimJ/RimL family protein N-acetyltransferase